MKNQHGNKKRKFEIFKDEQEERRKARLHEILNLLKENNYEPFPKNIYEFLKVVDQLQETLTSVKEKVGQDNSSLEALFELLSNDIPGAQKPNPSHVDESFEEFYQNSFK